MSRFAAAQVPSPAEKEAAKPLAILWPSSENNCGVLKPTTICRVTVPKRKNMKTRRFLEKINSQKIVGLCRMIKQQSGGLAKVERRRMIFSNLQLRNSQALTAALQPTTSLRGNSKATRIPSHSPFFSLTHSFVCSA